MKKADMSTHEANAVIDPLMGICPAEWSTSLQCARGSEKKFRKDWWEKVVSQQSRARRLFIWGLGESIGHRVGTKWECYPLSSLGCI